MFVSASAIAGAALFALATLAGEPENLGMEAAKFAAEFHTVCPRAPTVEADVVRAIEATGARREAAGSGIPEIAHAAPKGLFPSADLTAGEAHWIYESNDGWITLANVSTSLAEGRRETRCKMQMTSEEDHALFAGVLQHAARAVPTLGSCPTA